MKITILDPSPEEEDEIIIKCRHIDDGLIRMLREYGGSDGRLKCRKDGKIFFIPPKEIFYFESVDDKVFVYCEKEVYEIGSKLYELEELLPCHDFMRSSKSSVLCLEKIKSLAPAFGGRFEALLSNGEKVIISRQYVPELKRRLGL
ncbi:MAG: LytTR family transcriptional regulator [Oscillospiraceae bacterium]|nr:LytTR family transcriptional regulator [Oscillospiraceae bacterium]